MAGITNCRKLKFLSLLFSCVSLLGYAQQSDTPSWSDAKRTKKAILPVYWFESRPFIYRNKAGQLTGIEHDLVLNFADYIKQQYEVDLTIKWIEADGFQNTFDRVQQSTTPCLGASAFSITTNRKELIEFSPAYMPDIMVMISNKSIPVIESAEDFHKTFSRLTAVTIEGTTYENELIELKKKFELKYAIDYISSARNILVAIGEKPDSFGFIDLPIYLMYFSESVSTNVRRQNYYPVKRDGYGLLLPKNSDWLEPMQSFMTRIEFQSELEKIIARYLDLQLYRFIEELSLKSNSNLELLNKENAIQEKYILEKSEKLETQTKANYILTGLVIISTSLLVIVINLYRKKNNQKKEIEIQQKRIEFNNQQLEQRNSELILLNEEKNNLIKILAHDMRAPLNQIQGLSQILQLSNPNLPIDQKGLIQNILDGSNRLAKMISNILDVDALEGNRKNVLTETILVSPFTEKVLESFRKTADQKKITLHLLSDRANRKISVDALYLTQVLENLISNAIKFSPLGKRVDISIVGIHDKVRISIKDQGPGLTEQDQTNLFKKFQRLSNLPTNGEPSIGLGLSIVKSYTEMMGGRVWCESEPGLGAAFNVEFEEVS